MVTLPEKECKCVFVSRLFSEESSPSSRIAAQRERRRTTITELRRRSDETFAIFTDTQFSSLNCARMKKQLNHCIKIIKIRMFILKVKSIIYK